MSKQDQKMSAEELLSYVQEEVADLEDLYVVGIDKNGDPAMWATGDLAGLALAALLLQGSAMNRINGKLDEH